MQVVTNQQNPSKYLEKYKPSLQFVTNDYSYTFCNLFNIWNKFIFRETLFMVSVNWRRVLFSLEIVLDYIEIRNEFLEARINVCKFYHKLSKLTLNWNQLYWFFVGKQIFHRHFPFTHHHKIFAAHLWFNIINLLSFYNCFSFHRPSALHFEFTQFFVCATKQGAYLYW